VLVRCHGVEAPDANPTFSETTKLRLKARRSELHGRRHAEQAHSRHYVHGEVPRHAVSTVRCRPLGHKRWLATRLTLAEKPVVGADRVADVVRGCACQAEMRSPPSAAACRARRSARVAVRCIPVQHCAAHEAARTGARGRSRTTSPQHAVGCNLRRILWEQEAESSNLSIPTGSASRQLRRVVRSALCKVGLNRSRHVFRVLRFHDCDIHVAHTVAPVALVERSRRSSL
jgi:hypothetical protein